MAGSETEPVSTPSSGPKDATGGDNPYAPEILIESRDSVRIVTINRPDALNAVNSEVHRGLAGVWRHLAQDADARAVILTGAGSAFSAGGDMKMFKRIQTDPLERAALLNEARTVVQEVVDFPLPVVAAINGPAVGLGCSVAVLCDIVIMAESSYFQDPHVAVGLTAGDGGAPTWPLLMSMLRAKEYLFLCDRIPAAEAQKLGLANRVVPDDELMDHALALAQRLAAMPPQAIQSTKRALNMHVRRAMEGVLDYALAAEHVSFDTPEHRAVVAKFLGS
jgi:enoyl-CoA hydratase